MAVDHRHPGPRARSRRRRRSRGPTAPSSVRSASSARPQAARRSRCRLGDQPVEGVQPLALRRPGRDRQALGPSPCEPGQPRSDPRSPPERRGIRPRDGIAQGVDDVGRHTGFTPTLKPVGAPGWRTQPPRPSSSVGPPEPASPLRQPGLMKTLCRTGSDRRYSPATRHASAPSLVASHRHHRHMVAQARRRRLRVSPSWRGRTGADETIASPVRLEGHGGGGRRAAAVETAGLRGRAGSTRRSGPCSPPSSPPGWLGPTASRRWRASGSRAGRSRPCRRRWCGRSGTRACGSSGWSPSPVRAPPPPVGLAFVRLDLGFHPALTGWTRPHVAGRREPGQPLTRQALEASSHPPRTADEHLEGEGVAGAGAGPGGRSPAPSLGSRQAPRPPPRGRSRGGTRAPGRWRPGWRDRRRIRSPAGPAPVPRPPRRRPGRR